MDKISWLMCLLVCGHMVIFRPKHVWPAMVAGVRKQPALLVLAHMQLTEVHFKLMLHSLCFIESMTVALKVPSTN